MKRRGTGLAGAILALALIGLAVAPPRAAAAAQDLVNINSAGVQTLITLPGIGKEYAERIVAYRDKYGPFKKVEDLLNVRGIGEKTFRKIRDRLTVGKGR